MERFAHWLETGEEYAMNTKRVYLAAVRRIVAFWEENVREFIADQLLFPMENGVSPPTIETYLPTQTLSNKAMACKAFVALSKFLIQRFNTLYVGQSKYSLIDRHIILQSMKDEQNVASGKLDALNKKIAKEAKTLASVQSRNRENLKYNPGRVKEIMKLVENNEDRQAKLHSLAKWSPSRRIEQTETDSRHLLVSEMLIFSCGQRQCAFARMTIGELKIFLRN